VLPEFHIEGRISFLFDTGADISLLMPADWMRLGVQFADLTGATTIHGLGGPVHCGTAQCIVMFTDPGKTIFYHVISIAIAPPEPSYLTMPSILGRDVFDGWEVFLSPTRKVFDVKIVNATADSPIVPN